MRAWRVRLTNVGVRCLWLLRVATCPHQSLAPLRASLSSAAAVAQCVKLNPLLERLDLLGLLAGILMCLLARMIRLVTLNCCGTPHCELLWCNPTELKTDSQDKLRWLQDSNLLLPEQPGTTQQASTNTTKLRTRLEASNGRRAGETRSTKLKTALGNKSTRLEMHARPQIGTRREHESVDWQRFDGMLYVCSLFGGSYH